MIAQDRRARRLHLRVGRAGRASDAPTGMSEREPTPEQPAERRAATPVTVRPDNSATRRPQPFAANVPCDPVRGLSPHDGPAKESRRIESLALQLCDGAPTAESASSGSTCPGDRLRSRFPPTARPPNCPCRPKRPATAAPPPESAMSRETDSDLLQSTPTLGEARCVFVVWS